MENYVHSIMFGAPAMCVFERGKISAKQKAATALAAMLLSGGAYAADYTWMASPADANWNTSSLNWNSGEAWADDSTAPNNAVFPSTSSEKKITIPSGETRYINNITVSGSDYQISGGEGMLNMAGLFSISKNCKVYPIFSSSSVRIGSDTGSVFYYYRWAESSQTATCLEGSVIFAPNSDYCYGPVPSEPAENIFIASGNPCIFPNTGSITLNRNRTIKISAKATLRLGINGGPHTIKSLIAAEKSPGCDFSTNTVVSLPNNWAGLNVFDPGEGRTNIVGRIDLQSRLQIASGVTRLGSSKNDTGATAMLYVRGKDSNTTYDNYGNLLVAGGTLYASQTRYVDVSKYGHVTVKDGGRVYMPNVEWLNGYNGRGRLTVTNGEFCVNILRLSQDSYSEVHLEAGGLISVNRLGILPSATPQGLFRFDGGRIQARDGSNRNFLGSVSVTEATEDDWSNIKFAVGEKGAVFDTGNAQNIWWKRPLVSDAEHDGGVRKIGDTASGSNILVFLTTNCYNGVTCVESGGIQLRKDYALPSGSTLRLAKSDAYINANTFDSESPARDTTQWLSRVEGEGALLGCSNMHVTNSIAPSINGTLVFHVRCDLRGDYEITADANGCGLLDLRGENQSISNLKLKVADFETLSKDAPDTRYQILKATNGYTGKFVLPEDWPDAWKVRYTSTAAYLCRRRGMILLVR